MAKKTRKSRVKVTFVEIVADPALREYEQLALALGRGFFPNLKRVQLYRTRSGEIGTQLYYSDATTRKRAEAVCDRIALTVKRRERLRKKHQEGVE